MKSILLALLCSSLFTIALAAPPELVKKWETKADLKTPESVLFDGDAGLLYVSNIDGREPWTKDGKGSIGKVALDGKIIATEWVTGLEGPKGMGLHDGKLYVADIDAVVVIDVAKAAVAARIPVPDAKQLNDITIDPKGVIYVSDSATLKVHAIIDGKPTVWIEKLKGPNGLLHVGNTLYVLDDGVLYRVEPNRALTKIVDDLAGHTDGLEQVAEGEFIVSCWRGKMYHVKGAEKRLVLDTESAGVQSADIGYDAKKRIVYVPTFFKNTVVAFELK